MLTYSVDGHVAWLTFDRPAQLNAMLPSLWGELRAAIGRAEEDSRVRVVIFRGAGRAFSVGGDITAFGEITSIADRRAYLEDAMSAFRMIERCPKPTVAAVHGHALGGGCELTMVCDIVVADETARFGVPETAVGLVPGLGTVRGHANVNLHWMKYLVLTGESLSADEARLAGLVNFVVPEGQHETRALELADTMATKAPLALTIGKQLLARNADEGFNHGIEAIALLQSTHDHAEGIAAFKERRPARFEGR